MVCDLCPSAEAARPSGVGDRIRDALARLDPKFGDAAGLDKAFANIQGSSGKRPPNGRSGADREPATAAVFGSVEIDTVLPVKAFEAILNAHGRLLVLTLRLPG
jgi:hypothetical protein